MVKRLLGVMIIIILMAIGFAHAAEERGTAADAKAILAKAVAYAKEAGKVKALQEFSKPTGRFVNKDIYIYVVDMNGKCLAHAKVPALIGKDMAMLKDADGKLFVKETIYGAKTKGGGQVEYKWTNPISKKVEPKVTLYTKVGEMIICCGYYK